MNTKKAVYNHLALMGVFLPEDKLEQVYNKIQNEASKSIWSVLYEIENDESLKVYNDITKGAFKVKLVKNILKIDKKTNNKIEEFNSAYAAAKSIGLTKNEVGNILQVCEGKRKSAYGFKWEYSIKK